MTLSTTASRVQYPGAGSAGPFVFPFRVFAAADIKATKRSASGIETALAYVTDYTVAGVGDLTGSLTLNVPLAVGETLVIRRGAMTLTQPTSIRNQGSYYPATIEDAFDRFEMHLQQLQDQLDRSPRISESLDPAAFNLTIGDLAAGKVMTGTGVGLTMSTVAAAGVVALPGENRAITTLTQLLADNAVYNLKDYLAAGDNLQDDTPNILAAATALQAAGRGILKAPKGTYKVVGSIGAALFTFTNLNGVVIDFSEALIADAAVYVGVQEAVLFKFVNCRNITIVGRVSSQVAVTTNPATTAPRGLVVAQLTQGCKNITVDLDITGCKMGLEPTRLFNDPDAYRSSQIRGRIVAAGCYYPYAAQFSGDNAELAIDTDTCGRSYYVYGVSNQRLNVRAKNQQVTSLIWAFSGFGCRDITVKFVDRDSTANQAAAPRMQLGWGDLTPATHANINLTVDVLNPAGSPFGSTFEFIKYSDGGTTPDAVGRGHVLDGFKLAGTSEQVAGVNHVTQGAGAFAAPDICRNVRVRDLTVVGANAAISFGPSSPISQLVGRAIFENVISTGHNVLAYNGANGEVLFVGCQALNFSGAVGEADVHTLLDCNATDGTNQSTVNKTFINTKVGALLRNDYLSPGRFELVASKQLTGDITGAAQSIFKLTPAIGNGVLFRLKYFLVKDQGDFNPASRQEVEGVKTFSATMDGAGAWTLQQVVAAEVAERTLGAGPAVLTVSLVNGDATGAAIAVTATNYNNANGKHTFILEAIPMTPNARLIAL